MIWDRYRKRLFFGRNPDRGVEFIKDVWQRVKWQKLTLSMDEIKRAARREAQAKQRYLVGLTTGAPEEIWIDEGDYIKLILTFEVIQDIAMLASTERRIDDRSEPGEKD
jgi:hypothetical protein